jgi:hypothetical protein
MLVENTRWPEINRTNNIPGNINIITVAKTKQNKS